MLVARLAPLRPVERFYAVEGRLLCTDHIAVEGRALLGTDKIAGSNSYGTDTQFAHDSCDYTWNCQSVAVSQLGRASELCCWLRDQLVLQLQINIPTAGGRPTPWDSHFSRIRYRVTAVYNRDMHTWAYGTRADLYTAQFCNLQSAA